MTHIANATDGRRRNPTLARGLGGRSGKPDAIARIATACRIVRRTRGAIGFGGAALGCAVALAACGGFASEPPPFRLEATLPYRAERSDPITHEVDFSVVVTPPAGCEKLRVWLPLPASDAGQEIRHTTLSTFPEAVPMQIAQEPEYGNRFAYFEYRRPLGAQIIRHRFTATVWELRWRVDPSRVVPAADWPAEFLPYRKPYAIAEETAFVQTLGEIVPRDAHGADGLFGAMRWIDAHLTYDHVAASLAADAVHAFTRRRGHCSDYHGLCAAMGRALGYPTRVVYGLSLYPKNSPSHCKLEAFLPPYGWVSFDLSETQKLVQSIAADGSRSEADKQRLIDLARQRLHGGFRENSWLLVTRGTDYELAPRAAGRVSVIRTIYAEADGQPLPEPDPANPQQREFAWMTVHKYASDKPFPLPFQDPTTLAPKAP